MGAGSSSLTNASPKSGLHILRVTPASPASQTSIEPFFDFIVGFDEDTSHNIDAMGSELEKIVEQHEGQTLRLYVWNSKSQDTRVVPIRPSREWTELSNGAHPTEPEADARPSLLGLSMRICDPSTALDNVWHVMDVLEGSPAEMAGLVPYGDWVIGWSGGALSAEGDFYDVVEAHIDKPLRIYVYSYDFDTIREVVVIPNRHWGGEGLLGCIFGFGLLHRIPPPSADRQPGSLPLELEAGDEPESLFVPADDLQPRPGLAETISSATSLPASTHIRHDQPGRHAVHGGHAHHHHSQSSHEEDRHAHDHGHDHEHDHEHAHDHGHDHDHDHDHDHNHHHDHDHHDHQPAHAHRHAHSPSPASRPSSPSPLTRPGFPRGSTPLRASSFTSQRPASPGFSHGGMPWLLRIAVASAEPTAV
ncbi:hypothetical protein PUNSTDRAFT_110993 [Punctularia strigosozonata HHB-11173 SS5]|uniref:uncharacterized protein n=1 Tax=Punctularia strigosozonata (strain HHB-11173) TaxID=741275 RepID=UPI0004417152|nr:uncharacterized protein PUNSTDRAFT_110993 [Punctularia strigosozonata HHB-11173 SS5]EIN12543.1 hypothetical protein PUNSTDRAFT_110993 [Punctularia strigosozonata HHB-11173 SS5]